MLGLKALIQKTRLWLLLVSRMQMLGFGHASDLWRVQEELVNT